MKCVKSSTGDIIRVTDNKAKELVAKKLGMEYTYCNKKEWEEQRGKQTLPNQPQVTTGKLPKVGV